MPQPAQSSSNTETVRMQLPSGEIINGVVPSGLSDDDLKSYVRMKRPDLFGAPAGIPAPAKPNIQEVDTLGKPQNPASGYSGPGAWPNPEAAGKAGESNAYRAAVGGPIAGAAAVMGGSTALPFLAKAAQQHPIIATMAAQEGIHQLRQIPSVGRFIPGAAEWLPFLAMGARGPKAEPELATPSTDQLPGRPYMPNPRYEAPPEPSTLPARSGPLLLKGQVEAPPVSKPVSMGKLPWMPELEKSLGNEPTQIKPGVPIKNQVTPRESSAVEAYHYDPDAREFHVKPKGGATGYIYGDVSPEDAQAFDGAESKGKAWQQMRNNTLVGKVVNGKRVNVKPTSKSDQGNDLTDILTRSLQAARTPKQ